MLMLIINSMVVLRMVFLRQMLRNTARSKVHIRSRDITVLLRDTTILRNKDSMALSLRLAVIDLRQ